MDLTKARALVAAAIAACKAVTPPPSTAGMPTLELEFGAAGMLPWACGQTFKRGAIPSGSSVVANCAEFQCIPWSFHDDGSVRDAYVAGYCDVPAPGRARVTMGLGPPASGSNVAPGYVDVLIEVNGTPAVPSLITTVCAGPVMLQQQVVCALDGRLRVVYEVRHFRRGEKEVLAPCIENTGFLSASQPNRLAACVVRVGGATRFAEAIDVKHHTRITMQRGSTWSYWTAGDPMCLPFTDRPYACACESYPPYAPTPARPTLFTDRHPVGHPRAGQLVMRQDYAPNYVGEDGPGMGATGYKHRIGVLARHNTYPLTTGGRGAWDHMMAEALAVGSWSVHLRDELTDAPPLPSAHPTLTWQSTIPRGSGGENGSVDLAHQPSSVYVAAKLTGWKWFRDEHLYWTTFNHFYQQPPIRQNEKGILRTDVGTNQDRGAAWSLRTLAQAIALTGPTDPLHSELVTIWQHNMAYYRTRLAGPPYANNLGVIAPYSSSGTSLYAGGDRGVSTAWWGAGWMQAFLIAALGHALQLRLPITATAQDDTNAVFQFSAKWIVGLCGPTHWRRFGVYGAPWWADGLQKTPGTWYTSHTQMWAEYEYGHGLATLDPASGGTIKQHASNVDITGADWQTGRVAFYWPALVYAVMHQAPGAAEAFARIQSSASYPLLKAGIDNPLWAGMIPPGIKHPGA